MSSGSEQIACDSFRLNFWHAQQHAPEVCNPMYLDARVVQNIAEHGTCRHKPDTPSRCNDAMLQHAIKATIGETRDRSIKPSRRAIVAVQQTDITSTIRIACAGLALSFAAHAGATDLWINSDSRSRESLLASVVLLEVGTTNTCIVCKVQPSPIRAEAAPVPRGGEPGFYESVNRRREGKVDATVSPPHARLASDGSPASANLGWRGMASARPLPPDSQLPDPSTR